MSENYIRSDFPNVTFRMRIESLLQEQDYIDGNRKGGCKIIRSDVNYSGE